jgi:hypothetical protein
MENKIFLEDVKKISCSPRGRGGQSGCGSYRIVVHLCNGTRLEQDSSQDYTSQQAPIVQENEKKFLHNNGFILIKI